MAGIEKLKKCQLGLEASKGSEVNATALWLGDVTMTDNREATIPDENVGYLGPVDRSYIPFADADVEFAETPANYEQIGYPLSAGIKDVVTGSANGGTTNGLTYTYPLATTAVPTTKAYTIESGDNQQEYQAYYGFCQEITLKGAPKEAVTIASKWHAQTMGKGTFTAGVTVPTVEQILFQSGKIYSDAVGGTLGATQLTNTWLGFDMTIKTGLVPVHTGDGNLFFSFDKCTGMDVTGSIVFEHDAVGVAAYDDFVAGTTKKVRMQFLGSALTGNGGTFATKALQINMSMKILSVVLLDAVDGNDTVKVNFRAVYNATANLYFSIVVCNTLAALV
jgi:hypothetical protein